MTEQENRKSATVLSEMEVRKNAIIATLVEVLMQKDAAIVMMQQQMQALTKELDERKLKLVKKEETSRASDSVPG